VVIELEVLREAHHLLALVHVGVPQNCDIHAPLLERGPLLNLSVQNRFLAGVHVAGAQHRELCMVGKRSQVRQTCGSYTQSNDAL
jgi:hypothetical protein